MRGNTVLRLIECDETRMDAMRRKHADRKERPRMTKSGPALSHTTAELLVLDHQSGRHAAAKSRLHLTKSPRRDGPMTKRITDTL